MTNLVGCQANLVSDTTIDLGISAKVNVDDSNRKRINGR